MNYAMSETSQVENVNASEKCKETVEVLPLQYTPLEKMLMEKIKDMKNERDELF
jgi:hypothetical protein